MSSNHPIPQMVNISHALQSTAVEKIRSDIKDLQQVEELTPEQRRTVDNYIASLKLAFSQFTKDNEHVEQAHDVSITSADIQLYLGLKGMYADYLSQLEKIKQEKVTDKMKETSNNESILQHIKVELPKKHAKDRKLYMEDLIKNYTINKLPKKSSELIKAIFKLCLLDSDFAPTLKSYINFLKTMGYKYESVKKYVPADLENLISELFNDGIIKREEVLAPIEGNGDSNKQTLDEEPKKKISFSKYLKKGDEVVNNQSKREESAISDSRPMKKMKKSNKSTVTLTSILKTSGSNNLRKTSTGIKFKDDSQLVEVYGEGLPNEGLKVSPEELKKILKPFREGEPREVFLIENYDGKAKEFDIESHKSPEESDITETKGGPVPCDTMVPLKYRLNFSRFTSDLGSKPARDPVVMEDQLEKVNNSKGPLIMKAFGKNSLLLRKDRGGIPYRRIPDVVPINYPPRPIN